MRISTTILCTGTFALFAGFLVPPSIKAADVPDSAQVTKLLSETKTMAFQLKEDAVTMESFNFNNVSWETQTAAINTIKEHINVLGKQVGKLKAVKAEASPWQKTVIDRINPYLDEMVGYTTAEIEHIAGAREHNFAEYKDYLEANADYATDLAAMIGDFVSYGNAKNRVERLSTKLEVPK